jgi:hypothetical protein
MEITICERCQAATVPRVVTRTAILWNVSTFGPDYPDLAPPITRLQSAPQSADQLISRTDRGFVVFVSGRKEKALFIRSRQDRQ